MATIRISDFIGCWQQLDPAYHDQDAWEITANAPAIIMHWIEGLGEGYRVDGNVAIHVTASIETGVVIKGPAIIGPNALIAANAYLRGGVFVDANCIVGPSCELKTVIMFAGAKVAHLSFVGDSLIGANANVEAGAIVANYRNESDDKEMEIRWNRISIRTGVTKFGALIGDDVKIGANAVIAPGAILPAGTMVDRLALIDQSR